jgi:8-oxo-dGTP pyrophosphatase MutT (NUDIX family)
LSFKDIVSRFGGDFSEEDALSYAVTAIRETLEEAGVFFADGASARKPETDRICTLRLAENLPKDWFQNEVASGRWTLTFSRLYRWAHWITPEKMKPRFDTRFFLAFIPEAQVCRPDLREITTGLWIRPQEAMEKNLAGEVPLSPPTLVTLQELLPYMTKADLMEACQKRSWGKPLLPRMVPMDGGGVILEPWDKDYSRTDPSFNPRNLENAVLPAGTPFSKIWYNGKVWRPVEI